jgi:hypothetical protein
MNAIILKGAALRQPPLHKVAPEPKQLPTPALGESHAMYGKMERMI